MKLTRENKNSIVDEFRFAIQKMKDSQTADEKLFYFSSTYGAISRVFNVKFDPHLVFIHMILNTLYNNVKARMKAIATGDNAVKFPEHYFDTLTSLTEQLLAALSNDQDTYEILEKFVLLTFITTGNGYYLYERGLFRI